MQERRELAALYQTRRFTVTELARSFQISRRTAHKWLTRYAQSGSEGLADRARAPHRHPNATPPDVVEAVPRAKLVHPHYGPAKLRPGPEEPPEVAAAWPAPSTRGAILDRHGLVATAAAYPSLLVRHPQPGGGVDGSRVHLRVVEPFDVRQAGPIIPSLDAG